MDAEEQMESELIERGYQEGIQKAIDILENEVIYPYYIGLSIEEALTRFKVKLKEKLNQEVGK